MWYALLIPVLCSVIGYLLYKHKFTWWEIFIPVSASFVFIVISYFSMKAITLHDVEYNGYVITEARYYESYETWVSKTCTYTTCSGSGKTRTCVTHTYDCSYCDFTPARWCIIDAAGNEEAITESKYNSLIKKWKAVPEFQELNRDIKHHFSCGKDGDMYSIKWNNEILSSETTTYTHGFTNILKCNHSAFNYPIISDEQAKKEKLYEYPKLNGYVQHSVLGLDSLNISQAKKNRVKITLDYLNGEIGFKNKVRVYTLLFKNKDIKTAYLQEAYWDGGNQNEIVVCIGVDDSGNYQWVKPFSWTDGKRTLIDIREDLMEQGKLDEINLYSSYKSAIEKSWKFKPFTDFNYLSFEPTINQLILVYVLTTLISVLSTIWCIRNDKN